MKWICVFAGWIESQGKNHWMMRHVGPFEDEESATTYAHYNYENEHFLQHKSKVVVLPLEESSY